MQQFLEGPHAASGVTGAADASSMSCYAPLFAAAGVVDPRALDDARLQQLGVQKVFHRKRILRWARVLQSGSEPGADFRYTRSSYAWEGDLERLREPLPCTLAFKSFKRLRLPT